MTTETKKENWILYSDGSCIPNPGTGSWAFVIIDSNSDKKNQNRGFCLSTLDEEMTNNKMEIKAVIEGLRYFIFEMNKINEEITLISDSSYVVKAIDKWLSKWESNNWITYENKPVKNKYLWEEISTLKKLVKLTCIQVKGHDVNFFNNLADKLAVDLTQSVINLYNLDTKKKKPEGTDSKEEINDL